jgi:hypothetical protein
MSAESASPDMQAFPLLRPDMIPTLADHWLQRAQMQILPLIDTLSAVSVQLLA